MENLGFLGVGAITVICYLLALVLKASALNDKWLPAFCGLCGGVLGIAALYMMPSFPANDVLNACAEGIVSGLAATGANQVYKQLFCKTEADK